MKECGYVEDRTGLISLGAVMRENEIRTKSCDPNYNQANNA